VHFTLLGVLTCRCAGIKAETPMHADDTPMTPTGIPDGKNAANITAIPGNRAKARRIGRSNV
jgi:hypothetical protein